MGVNLLSPPYTNLALSVEHRSPAVVLPSARFITAVTCYVSKNTLGVAFQVAGLVCQPLFKPAHDLLAVPSTAAGRLIIHVKVGCS